MIIKTSGFILGNTTVDNGYCYLDLNGNIINGGTPSMETYFHLFTKKYTVHLHFIPIIINNLKLDNFELNHQIIDYYPPGELLANKIKEKYNSKLDIIFLKNHGIILTSNNINELN